MNYGRSNVTAQALNSGSASASAYELKSNDLPGMSSHQLTVVRNGSATGNIGVKIKPVGSSVAETLYAADGATARTISSAAPATIMFDGFIDAVVLDLSGVTGGTVDVILESRT